MFFIGIEKARIAELAVRYQITDRRFMLQAKSLAGIKGRFGSQGDSAIEG